MELKNLIEKCSDALQQAANESEDYSETTYLSEAVQTDNGTIDLYYYKEKGKWLCDVSVIHDSNYYRESKNIEKYLAEQLEDCVDWDVAEEEWKESSYDEWNEHGFRDEADYNNWRYGGTKW